MSSARLLRIRVAGTEREFDGSRAVTLGRDLRCDIAVGNAKASRFHGRLFFDPEHGWIFEDSGSSNGSFVGTRRVKRTVVTGQLTVRLGHPELGEEVVLAAGGATSDQTRAGATYPVSGRMSIGRSRANDIVVDDLQVSRRHAEVAPTPAGRVALTDCGSHNGTFLNGRRVQRVELAEGDVIGVGRHAFRFSGGVLHEHVDSGRVRFEAAGLTFRTPSGQTILDGVSFVLEPASFLAVLGPAGAGKSTLMKALVGSQPAEEGQVYYGDLDFYEAYEELRSRVGYVPQEDILHPQLRLRPALQFAADLRFPADSAEADRSARVGEVLEELGLAERAGLQIAKLSGGQRKRTNVAQELLTKPSLLLLDEPTTGLDPGLVKSMMELLRQLADNGRTVIVITHSLQSIELCDLVLMLAPGGSTAYLGPPADMLPYFGRTENADVFQDLQRGDTDWKSRFEAHEFHGRYVTTPSGQRPSPAYPRVPPVAPPGLQPWSDQLRTLARRQMALLSADRRNFLFLALGVLLPGLAIMSLVGGGALRPAQEPQTEARVLLLALVVAATCVAAANGLREIVKEVPIFLRDRAAGMSIGAYLGSKLLVLGTVTLVQVVLLVLIGTAGAEPGGSSRLALVSAVALSSLGALALGLLISSLVNSSEKAMALIAVLFVGQWLFSGAAVDLHDKPPLQVVGYLTSANWGMAAAAAGTDLYRLEQQCLPGLPAPPDVLHDAPPCDGRWRSGTGWLALDLAALAGLMAMTAGGAFLALRRRDAFARPK